FGRCRARRLSRPGEARGMQTAHLDTFGWRGRDLRKQSQNPHASQRRRSMRHPPPSAVKLKVLHPPTSCPERRMVVHPPGRANVAGRDATISEVFMDIQDAQREVRSVYIGGFWGQLVSSVIWLVSAALGTWVTPRASILAVVIGGFFIFGLTQMLLRLSGRRARVSRENPLHWLGMQVAFVLPFSMLLLVPVGFYRLNWFFPALMILL